MRGGLIAVTLVKMVILVAFLFIVLYVLITIVAPKTLAGTDTLLSFFENVGIGPSRPSLTRSVVPPNARRTLTILSEAMQSHTSKRNCLIPITPLPEIEKGYSLQILTGEDTLSLSIKDALDNIVDTDGGNIRIVGGGKSCIVSPSKLRQNALSPTITYTSLNIQSTTLFWTSGRGSVNNNDNYGEYINPFLYRDNVGNTCFFALKTSGSTENVFDGRLSDLSLRDASSPHYKPLCSEVLS